MRSSMKQQGLNYCYDPMFYIDHHHFINMQGEKASMEMATELGVSLHDVQFLKKKLTRN